MSTPIHDQLAAEKLDETALLGEPVHLTHPPRYRHSLCGEKDNPRGPDGCRHPDTPVTCADCVELGESRFCVRCGGPF